MKRMLLTAALLAAGMGLCLSPLSAASAAKEKKKGGADNQFVQKASAAGLAEVNLGVQAERRAGSADVRNYARRIVQDHTMANRELLDLANRKSLTLPRTMDEKHQALSDKMAKMRGREFDRAFVHHMVQDHEEAIKLFEDEAKDGKDKDVQAFAEKTLPTLREHLELAQKLEGKEGGAKEEGGAEEGGKTKGGKTKGAKDTGDKESGGKDKENKDKESDNKDR